MSTKAAAVEMVVFDVDGVLVDVRESFREAVRQTVRLFGREAGVTDPWVPSHEDLQALKLVGGFNDDVDLTIALVQLARAGVVSVPADLRREIEAAGGGLPGVRAAVAGLAPVDEGRIVAVYDELYWGEEGSGRRGPVSGLCAAGRIALRERETPLAPVDFLQRVRSRGVARVGLVTGRTPAELDAALDLLGWSRADFEAVVTGDRGRKPDPACLDLVFGRNPPESALYVGDTRDDWELVRRWRVRSKGGTTVACAMVAPPDDAEAWRRRGADAVIANVSAILPSLRGPGARVARPSNVAPAQD